VDDEAKQGSPRCCTTRRDEKQRRLRLVSFLMNGLLLPGDKLVESLELLIAPEDRIALEGDNQKQTDS
jgi:malonate decarboxylase alpha subunit